MVNSCANCGGALIYDIESKTIRCGYCNSAFDPESFRGNTDAEEYQEIDEIPEAGKGSASKYDVTLYSCPNCGGEITSLDQAAVDYCMYCGSFVTLQKKMSKMTQPKQILPFSVTKEECKNRYRKSLHKYIYAPKEFRDSEFLNGFSGIYIPYWHFQYQYGPELKVRGKKEKHEGDYKVTQHFDIKVKAEGEVNGITYDASSHLDDTLSAKIAPFDGERMKPFSPAYMFGFFGDMADVRKGIYDEDADEEASDLMWNTVKKNKGLSEGHPQDEKPKTLFKDFNIKKSYHLAMLPVWFLTWRKGDHVAYSIMNGDSGEIYSEVPIDIKRYLAFSLLTAIPLFFLLEMMFTLTASTMLTVSMLLSFFMMVLYTFELDKIARKLMHTDDKGYLSRHPDAKEKSDDNISDNFLLDLWDTVKEIGWYFPIILIAGSLAFYSYMIIALVVLVIFVPVYSIYRIVKNAALLHDKTIWVDCAGAFASILLSGIILIADPAPDRIYYICSILSMLAIAFTAVRMMRRYNELITRPLPNFFNRKGGV